MTERQVWLKLAEMILAAGPYPTSGLCYQMREIYDWMSAPVRDRVYAKIRRRVYYFAKSDPDWAGWGWRLDPEGMAARIAFCKRQVARIDRERRKRGKRG